MIINPAKEDKIISEVLKSFGQWSKYILISGGFAPIIYRLYFKNDASSIFPVRTTDVDSLISRKIKDLKIKKDIAKHLFDAGFTRKIGLDIEEVPGEKYIKKINGEEIEIEFLTDK